MPTPDETYNVAYTDKDGIEVRYRVTLTGEPEPINNCALPRRRLQISNFRQWRDGEPEPIPDK